MKHVNPLALAFLIIFTACSKDEDTTTKPCTVTTFTANLLGKWKLANTGSIMVKVAKNELCFTYIYG